VNAWITCTAVGVASFVGGAAPGTIAALRIRLATAKARRNSARRELELFDLELSAKGHGCRYCMPNLDWTHDHACTSCVSVAAAAGGDVA